MGLLLTILGALLILEGLPYFAFPRKAKEWALMLQEVPDRGLRLMGIFAMAVGLIILYLVRYI